MDGRGRTREVRRFLYVRLGPKAPLQAIGAPVGHSKASKIKTTQKLPRSSVYVEVCGIHVTESLQNASSECGRGPMNQRENSTSNIAKSPITVLPRFRTHTQSVISFANSMSAKTS